MGKKIELVRPSEESAPIPELTPMGEQLLDKTPGYTFSQSNLTPVKTPASVRHNSQLSHAVAFNVAVQVSVPLRASAPSPPRTLVGSMHRPPAVKGGSWNADTGMPTTDMLLKQTLNPTGDPPPSKAILGLKLNEAPGVPQRIFPGAQTWLFVEQLALKAGGTSAMLQPQAKPTTFPIVEQIVFPMFPNCNDRVVSNIAARNLRVNPSCPVTAGKMAREISTLVVFMLNCSEYNLSQDCDTYFKNLSVSFS